MEEQKVSAKDGRTAGSAPINCGNLAAAEQCDAHLEQQGSLRERDMTLCPLDSIPSRYRTVRLIHRSVLLYCSNIYGWCVKRVASRLYL